MKNLLRVLLVVILCVGFTSCINDDFDELEKEGIEVPLNTDPDDDDEVDPPTGNPKNIGG